MSTNTPPSVPTAESTGPLATATRPVEALHGLAAEFDSPEALREAVGVLVGAGYCRGETYTPFPVEGLAEQFRLRRTYMAPLVGLAALTGATGAFFMQWFANVVHYPWIVGGKPANSWPMWIPITFEGAILFGAVFGVLGMLYMNDLPRLYHPLFRLPAFARASQDRFFVCVEAADPAFDRETVARLLASCRPLAVMEVPR